MVWGLMALAFVVYCVALQVWGSDINPGYNFAPNEKHIDDVKLNELVGNATINPSFFSGQSAAQPVAGDTFLFYQSSSGQFRRGTMDVFLFSNTNLIASQLEDTSPQTNDFVLTYDVSGNVFKKVSLGFLTMSNAFLLANQYEDTNAPAANAQFLTWTPNSAGYERRGQTNIFSQWWRWMMWANRSNSVTDPTNFLLSAHTKPTNSDALWIWDSHANTNKYITLAGLVTNLPTAAYITNTDYLPIFSTLTNAANAFGTNPVLSKFPVAALGGTRFTSVLFPVPAGTGGSNTLAHNLGGAPQNVRWVLVETNVAGDAASGYVAGDELDMLSAPTPWGTGANATNVWIVAPSSITTWTILPKTGGSGVSPTARANFNVKVYATYYSQ